MTEQKRKEVRIKMAKQMIKQHMKGDVYLTTKGLERVMLLANQK